MQRGWSIKRTRQTSGNELALFAKEHGQVGCRDIAQDADSANISFDCQQISNYTLIHVIYSF